MTNPMSDGWRPCPVGELDRLAARLVFRNRLRSVVIVAGLLLGAAGVAAGGWAIHTTVWASPAGETEPQPCCGDLSPPADGK